MTMDEIDEEIQVRPARSSFAGEDRPRHERPRLGAAVALRAAREDPGPRHDGRLSCCVDARILAEYDEVTHRARLSIDSAKADDVLEATTVRPLGGLGPSAASAADPG